jgi:excinuclease UvrABC ATPase subunit
MQHSDETIEIIGARAHNLKNIDVPFQEKNWW